MGLFSRKSRSSSSQSTPPESSRPSQPPQQFNYSQYPDGLIPNPGGYSVQSPSPVSSNPAPQYDHRPYTQTSSPPPQQSYPSLSQQAGVSDYNNINQYSRQQNASYQVTNQPVNNSALYQQEPRYPVSQGLPHHQQQQQQQQQQQHVTVNLFTNTGSTTYQRQPQPQGPNQYQQRAPQGQGIQRCRAGHLCERHEAKKGLPANIGRFFWRCRECDRFVVWDDER